MSDISFHATVLGRKYYEHTVLELVLQIGRLNGLVGHIAGAVESHESILIEPMADVASTKARRAGEPEPSERGQTQ